MSKNVNYEFRYFNFMFILVVIKQLLKYTNILCIIKYLIDFNNN